MTAAWPTTLPQVFLRDGYSDTEADNVLASSVSVGPDKLRRRTTANIRQITGAMLMTATQVAILRSFVTGTIGDRALSFTFPDPEGGAALLVRLRSPAKKTALGILWRVTLDLEVLP